MTLQDLTGTQGTLLLSGPKARAILASLTSADLSTQVFPWLSAQEIEVAGVRVRAMRVSFVGELGWELHHPISAQARLAAALFDAGKNYQLAWVGLRAMDSLRIEKMYRNWRSDLNTDFNLIEAGMKRFVRLQHERHFAGRQALEAVIENGPGSQLALVEVDDTDLPCDPFGGEPIMHNSHPVGIVTSGTYAHHSRKSLAIAYIDAQYLERPGLQVRILGQSRPIKVHTDGIYDPQNLRQRA